MSRDSLLVLATALALLTLSAPVASLAMQTYSAFDKALEKGKALMEKGNCKAAIRPLKKAEELSREPSIQVLLGLGICSNRIGKYEDAESYARAAVEVAQNPAEQAGAFNMLGLSLLKGLEFTPDSGRLKGLEFTPDSGRFLEAEAAFRKVLALTDGQANMARYNLGEVLNRQKRYQEAHATFAEYLERAPDGYLAAQARSAMDWIACAQSVGYSEPRSNDDPEISSEGEPSGPFRVGGNDKAPEKIRAPNPQYTERAREARIQGTMIFKAIIDKKGAVRCLNILKGLPMGLSEAAAKAIGNWRFKPATRFGKPVAVIYNGTVTFSIQ